MARLKDLVCSYKVFYYHLLALEVAVLVILLFSFVTIQSDGPSYTLLLIDFALLFLALAATVSVLYYCKDY